MISFLGTILGGMIMFNLSLIFRQTLVPGPRGSFAPATTAHFLDPDLQICAGNEFRALSSALFGLMER